MIYTDERRIKAEQKYINGGVTLRELAKEDNISIGTLNKWCKQYEWVKKRAKVEKRAMKKAVTQAVNRKSKELAKEIAAVDSLAASLEKAAALLEKALSIEDEESKGKILDGYRAKNLEHLVKSANGILQARAEIRNMDKEISNNAGMRIELAPEIEELTK